MNPDRAICMVCTVGVLIAAAVPVSPAKPDTPPRLLNPYKVAESVSCVEVTRTCFARRRTGEVKAKGI